MRTHADAGSYGEGSERSDDASGTRLRDLSLGEWREIGTRAVRGSLDDNVPMMASALAYSAFFAIPSMLLLLLGVFTLVADDATITHLVDRLTIIAPSDAATLFGDSLRRLSERPSTGIALTLVGLGLAAWSMTNAMSTVISALNVAYDRHKDTRGFVRSRLAALAMAFFVGSAALLAGALLILGPQLQRWLGSVLDARGAVHAVWLVAQWPLLIAALLFAFSIVLHIGPGVQGAPPLAAPQPGVGRGGRVWLTVSWAFSYYTARFGTYDKTWGTLGAVIVTLIWLWLAGISLLFGGELNAETERLRGGLPPRGTAV